MHFPSLLLLAALTNIANTSPLRLHDLLTNHDRFRRFYNITAEEQSMQSKIDTTTLSPSPTPVKSSTTARPLSAEHSSEAVSKSLFSSSSADALASSLPVEHTSISSKAATTVGGQINKEIGIPEQTSETKVFSTQIASIANAFSSAEAVKISTNSPSLVSTSSPQDSVTSRSAPLEGAGALTKPPAPTQTLHSDTAQIEPVTAGEPKAKSAQESSSVRNLESSASPATIASFSSQASLDVAPTASSQHTGGEQSKVSGVTAGTTTTSQVQSAAMASASAVQRNYPSAANGNLAMAVGFNQLFKSLNPLSSCNPKDNNSFVACVDGQPSKCEEDGTYTLESCPQGQSCYAMPRPEGQSGIDIGCAVPSVAAQRLAANPSPASSAVATNGAAALPSSEPSQSSSAVKIALKVANTQLSAAEPTGSPSVQTALTETAAASALIPAGGPSYTKASISSALPENRIAQVQSYGPEHSSSVVGPAKPVEEPSTVDVKAGPLATHTSAFGKPNAAAQASSTGEAPLVLSFPYDLSSASPTPAETQAPAATTRAVDVASNQKDKRPPFESVAAAVFSASPAPAGQGAANNNVPATSVEAPGTSISTATGADAAGITIVPLGAPESGKDGILTKTVYVTVTTTVHD